MPKQITTEEFTKDSSIIHSNFYDYSKTEYVGANEKIIIICPVHGEFSQKAFYHKNGAGCKNCQTDTYKQNYKTNPLTFIQKVNEVHNFKYDYTKTNYVNNYTKICIICKTHGEFIQKPSHHLDRKHGCPKCGKEIIKTNSGWTLDKFKKQCLKNNKGLGIIYIIRCFNNKENFYKIGITSRSIKRRFPNRSTLPYQYEIIQEIQDIPENIYYLEKELHKYYKNQKYIPNLKFDGSSECFQIIDI